MKLDLNRVSRLCTDRPHGREGKIYRQRETSGQDLIIDGSPNPSSVEASQPPGAPVPPVEALAVACAPLGGGRSDAVELFLAS